LVLQGLPGLWRRLEGAALEAVLQRGSAWAQQAARRSLEGRVDARAQLGACLNVLEHLGALNDTLWVGPVLVGQLLPCIHIPREVLLPFVRRAWSRALQRGRAGEEEGRLLFRLFNHPEYALVPGVEAALGEALGERPTAACLALEWACAVISGPDKLAGAAEACLEAHFSWSADWAAALAALTPPELEPEEFFEAAVRDQCVLVLAACACKSRERGRVLVPGWLRQLRVTPAMAWKVPLLWGLALAAWVGPQAPAELLRVWSELGRDTSSNAVVSMLGFGDKSPYSVEFRLFSRLLRLFVVPESKELRAIQAANPRLEPAAAWIEKRQPLSKALECVEMVGTVLFPNVHVWRI
jgi:hypothetical protein